MSTPSHPNVVFIVGDNVGWGDIGCYGGLAPTPRIDALADEGLRFKNYNVEAQCTPTRSAILSGRLPIRTGNCSVPLVGETGRVPTDRPIDGVDASPFLLGNSTTTGRDHVIYYGSDGAVMSVKWRTMKVVLRYSESTSGPIHKPQWPLVFDLIDDPVEEWDLIEKRLDRAWVLRPVAERLGALAQSAARYPHIKPGEEFTGYS